MQGLPPRLPGSIVILVLTAGMIVLYFKYGIAPTVVGIQDKVQTSALADLAAKDFLPFVDLFLQRHAEAFELFVS
jgi:hypothetical protein